MPQQALQAVSYARVSTSGQANEGVSLEAQAERIAAHCKSKDLHLIRHFTDAGVSGRKASNRPELQAALTHCCQSKAVLVVYSLSRLARSTRDAMNISDRLDKAGAQLVSLSESIDTTTAAGKMFFRLMSVISEFESDQISERVLLAVNHKRRNREKYSLHAPFGFRFDESRLIPDEKEQAVLHRMRALRSKGKSYAAIARSLVAEGMTNRVGQPFPHQHVRLILLRRGNGAETKARARV